MATNVASGFAPYSAGAIDEILFDTGNILGVYAIVLRFAPTSGTAPLTVSVMRDDDYPGEVFNDEDGPIEIVWNQDDPALNITLGPWPDPDGQTQVKVTGTADGDSSIAWQAILVTAITGP